ncbi:hypothetical protein [Clostridium aciditolerans]|uniref:Uncharacterized protein n=1 Tax=Clostridium aciditolerans TaxID=339861 RepID=A0A934HZG9_9CLOT|nr:hypothetical protein [Clostridium aciditolerans]MBI6872336.1 hypothetical protein [Clostridium aciditolerans]
MKRLSKKTYVIIAISIIILIYIIGMYKYRKPITIHKTFSNVLVIKPGTQNTVKAEINAKIYRGIYRGSIISLNLHFINRIEGKIIIDDKEYNFEGYNGESKLINIIGDVHENNKDASVVFWFKMNDLDSIELLSKDSSG